MYGPRGSRQSQSVASDFWDSPDYTGQKTGSWSAFTLGDIRQVEKALESGGMSLQEYMLLQQQRQAKEQKGEEGTAEKKPQEDKKPLKDAAGQSVKSEKRREVWREKEEPDVKEKVVKSAGVGLGGVALQDDVEEEFSFFDDHAVRE